MKKTDWSLLPTIMEMVDRLELRLTDQGCRDNMITEGLWLKLFPDGSGVLFEEYSPAREDDSQEKRLLQCVMDRKNDELAEFDSLEELHGELVLLTMRVG